jgi:hypothetical protein
MESRTSEFLILTHSLLLGERLYLFVRLRFLAAAGILLGASFATQVVGVRGLPLTALAAAAGFLALYNVGAFIAVCPHLAQGDGKASHRRLVYIAQGAYFRNSPALERQELSAARPQGSASASPSFVAYPKPTLVAPVWRAMPGRVVRSSCADRGVERA